MAVRSVYIPVKNSIGVLVKNVEFDWFPGFAVSQKQKSIVSLHAACARSGVHDVLEISTKSLQEDGISASAFNLTFHTKKSNRSISVESAFQGSKVFEFGGPFEELYDEPPYVSKKAIRSLAKGKLIEFQLFGKSFPIKPTTFFYDWLYMNSLNMNERISEAVQKFDGFTDIEFNPSKSVNCQAFSAALFVSICQNGKRDEIKAPIGDYAKLLTPFYEKNEKRSSAPDRLI